MVERRPEGREAQERDEIRDLPFARREMVLQNLIARNARHSAAFLKQIVDDRCFQQNRVNDLVVNENCHGIQLMAEHIAAGSAPRAPAGARGPHAAPYMIRGTLRPVSSSYSARSGAT